MILVLMIAQDLWNAELAIHDHKIEEAVPNFYLNRIIIRIA